MADENTNHSPRADATPSATTDTEAAMKREMANLKRQVTRLTRQLSEQAESVTEDVSSVYDDASDRATRATRAFRSQAQTVSDTVRQNPGTHGSALLLGGIVGLAIGLMLGQSDDRRWWSQ